MGQVAPGRWLLGLVCLAALAPARAEAGPAAPHRVTGLLEAGGSHAELTKGNASWDDQYVRGEAQVRAADRVSAEVSHQRHFRDEGTYFGLGASHLLDEAWQVIAAAAASDRGTFLPRSRLDAAVKRKWLERRSLVTTLGATYVRSRGPYYDVAVLAGATYYLDAPWILDAGVRVSRSSPGAIRSARGALALMHGYDRRYWVTLRVDAGNEAWQVVAADAVRVDFPSVETALVWRQWLVGRFGLNLRATHYWSRNYVRTSMDLGVFMEF